MLRANPEALEVVAWILLRQDLAAMRAEVRETGVAAHVVVFPVSRHASAAPRALAHLPPVLRRVHELRQEARLMRARLCLSNLVGLLVPASNLLIVKKSAFARGKMVVTVDLFVATPAEVSLAIATSDLAATLSLLDAHPTLWARLGCLCQMAQGQQFRLCGLCFSARSPRPRFERGHSIIRRLALHARMEGAPAPTTEHETTSGTTRGVVIIL